MRYVLMVLIALSVAVNSAAAGPKLIGKKVKNGKDGEKAEVIVGFDGIAQFKFPSSCDKPGLTEKQAAACKAWVAFRVAAAEADIDLKKK